VWLQSTAEQRLFKWMSILIGWLIDMWVGDCCSCDQMWQCKYWHVFLCSVYTNTHLNWAVILFQLYVSEVVYASLARLEVQGMQEFLLFFHDLLFSDFLNWRFSVCDCRQTVPWKEQMLTRVLFLQVYCRIYAGIRAIHGWSLGILLTCSSRCHVLTTALPQDSIQ